MTRLMGSVSSHEPRRLSTYFVLSAQLRGGREHRGPREVLAVLVRVRQADLAVGADDELDHLTPRVVDERPTLGPAARLECHADVVWVAPELGRRVVQDPFDGPVPYAALPGLTKGFSACLMPFALNAATEYINPTKALEYMAAGRPVVSTALSEVRSNFSAVAHIAASHDEFIAHCQRETKCPTMRRVKAGLRLAGDNTWESLLAKMERHILEVLPVPDAAVTTTAPALNQLRRAVSGV